MGGFILLFLTVIISIYALLFYMAFSGHDFGDYDDSDLFSDGSNHQSNSAQVKLERPSPIIYDYEDYIDVDDGIICPDCDADDCDHIHDWL